MAQTKFTIDLQEAAFPLVSSMNGKAVMIPNLDQENVKPQMYWLENVIPKARGVATPSFTQSILSGLLPFSINSAAPENTEIFTVYSEQDNSTYLLVYGTEHYLYDSILGAWNLVGTTNDVDVRTSVFYLKGKSYIFHPTIGLNVVNEFCTDYVPVTVTGLSLTGIVSMCSSLSYIIATDGDTIYWSSPLNELSFDPTGTGEDANAGNTKVLAVKGNINFLKPSAKGFIIYATVNSSEVLYTGNANNPWRFIPVLNSNGVYKPWHHTSESNGSVHFLWSDTGLAAVQEGQSQQIFPEVSDFLTGNIYEEFNYLTNLIEQTPVPDSMEVKISFVANRYLCISYGPSVSGILKFILVHDLVLKRWGRLKIDHLTIFNLDLPQRTGAIYADAINDSVDQEAQDFDTVFAAAYLPGEADSNFRAAKFGIFTPDGAIVEVNLSDSGNNVDGLIIYGEVALTRNRNSEIIEIELDGINTNVEIQGRSQYETRIWGPWTDFTYAPTIDVYQNQISGKRHELKIKGSLYLSSVVITATVQGTA